MKLSFIIFIFLSINGCSQSGIVGSTPIKNPPANFSEFEAMANKVKYRRFDGNPIITYGASWKQRQVHFPQVIEDPNEPDSLIMFYGGGSILDASTYQIGRAMASKANPYKWIDYGGNPLFVPSDYSNIGTIVGVDDAWWNPTHNRFELTCCTYPLGLGYSYLGKYWSNDGFTFTYEGPAIFPDGDENFLGNGGILRDGSTWYLAYTYRTSVILPGVRIASSTDSGATWTKHGTFLSLGTSGAYDDQYMEGVQFLKVGSDYILNYGCAKANGGTPNIKFSGALAHSTSALGTYTKSSINPFFEHSTSGWDATQVSTIVVFDIPGVESWLMFWQGTATAGDYGFALWSMGMASFY